MEQWLEEYRRYLDAERNASLHTISNYTREIREFMGFARQSGVMDWASVTPALLRQWLASLHERGYVKASISRRVSELRAFYTFLVIRKHVLENPVRAISAPKLPRRLPRPLTSAEITRLLEAPDCDTPQGQRDRAMLEVLYAGGLRISELLALDLSNLDLVHGEIRVLGKGAKERVVLIGQPAVCALQGYLADGRQKLLTAGGCSPAVARTDGRVPSQHARRRSTPALFLNRFGSRLSVSMFTRQLGQYARSVGIEHRVTPHMLRHSFATHLLDGGADLRSVQELLGHENVSTTQIYTQVSQAHLRNTVLNAHPLARREPDLGAGIWPADESHD